MPNLRPSEIINLVRQVAGQQHYLFRILLFGGLATACWSMRKAYLWFLSEIEKAQRANKGKPLSLGFMLGQFAPMIGLLFATQFVVCMFMGHLSGQPLAYSLTISLGFTLVSTTLTCGPVWVEYLGLEREGVTDEDEKSLGWVAGMLALVVAYFGWGFLAADYFQNDPSGEPGKTSFWVDSIMQRLPYPFDAAVAGPRRKTSFWVNSITQLPNCLSVLDHAYRNRFWVIVLFGVLAVGVLILWGILRKLERELGSK
jgi:hypothetical protein